MKVDILAIGAHPDDVELSCNGSLLRHLDQGKTVGLLDLTRGELGSRGTAEIRDEEGRMAAEMLGASFRENIALADGFFEYNQNNLLKIIEVLRWCQPEIVLLNAPSDRHPDHGRAAKLCADACFFSGLVKIVTTDKEGQEQEKWRPKAVYHYIQDHDLKPDFLVDISDYIDRKMEIVLAFKSQFLSNSSAASEYAAEPETPISGEQFFNYLRARAATAGRIAGLDYAEGFICVRPPAVTSFFDLI